MKIIELIKTHNTGHNAKAKERLKKQINEIIDDTVIDYKTVQSKNLGEIQLGLFRSDKMIISKTTYQNKEYFVTIYSVSEGKKLLYYHKIDSYTGVEQTKEDLLDLIFEKRNQKPGFIPPASDNELVEV